MRGPGCRLKAGNPPGRRRVRSDNPGAGSRVQKPSGRLFTRPLRVQPGVPPFGDRRLPASSLLPHRASGPPRSAPAALRFPSPPRREPPQGLPGPLRCHNNRRDRFLSLTAARSNFLFAPPTRRRTSSSGRQKGFPLVRRLPPSARAPLIRRGHAQARFLSP